MNEHTSGWICEAYTPELAEIGVICFFGGGVKNRRVCADRAECHGRMVEKRQALFSHFQEQAAAGDPVGVYLEEQFTHPEQIFGGGLSVEDEEEPDSERQPPDSPPSGATGSADDVG